MGHEADPVPVRDQTEVSSTEFLAWVSALTRHDGDVQMLEGNNDSHFALVLYTERNSYKIFVAPDYLGCVASARKPRTGEDWTRGNDLADGPFTADTWIRILHDIVSYEAVKLSTGDKVPTQYHNGAIFHGTKWSRELSQDIADLLVTYQSDQV